MRAIFHPEVGYFHIPSEMTRLTAALQCPSGLVPRVGQSEFIQIPGVFISLFCQRQKSVKFMAQRKWGSSGQWDGPGCIEGETMKMHSAYFPYVPSWMKTQHCLTGSI